MGSKWYLTVLICFSVVASKFEHLFLGRAMMFECVLCTYRSVPSQEREWELGSKPYPSRPGVTMSYLQKGLTSANLHQGKVWVSTSPGHILISHLAFQFWEFLAHILSPPLSWRSCDFLLIFSHFLHIIIPFWLQAWPISSTILWTVKFIHGILLLTEFLTLT